MKRALTYSLERTEDSAAKVGDHRDAIVSRSKWGNDPRPLSSQPLVIESTLGGIRQIILKILRQIVIKLT
jgi:hypothetical protein